MDKLLLNYLHRRALPISSHGRAPIQLFSLTSSSHQSTWTSSYSTIYIDEVSPSINMDELYSTIHLDELFLTVNMDELLSTVHIDELIPQFTWTSSTQQLTLASSFPQLTWTSSAQPSTLTSPTSQHGRAPTQLFTSTSSPH